MSQPDTRDILFRAGATTLARYGVLSRRIQVIGRGGEAAIETEARADATTCATFFGSDGLLRIASANILRVDYGGPTPATAGILQEGTRTNLCQYCRDLTQASVWTPTSITITKDQTGIDGVASSCSKITASANNGTILQAATLASSVRRQSAFVKRVTGSGAVSMTTDGGSTWTVVTVTAAWTRVVIPPQTVTNPSFGFKLATSGDAIAVDAVQNEGGSFESSPILTTNATKTRAADDCTIPIGFGVQDLTVLVVLNRTPQADAVGSISDGSGLFDLGNASNKHLWAYFDTSARNIIAGVRGLTTDRSVSAAIPAGATLSFAVKMVGQTVLLDVGSGYSAPSAATEVFTTWNQAQLRLGGIATNSWRYWGSVQDTLIARGAWALADMQAAL